MRRHTFLLAVLSSLSGISLSMKSNPEELPTVIWWTDLLFPHSGKSVEIKCPYGGRCIAQRKHRSTSTQGERSPPTAFLFYGTDFSGASLPLPRLPHHPWALLHEESPMNNFLFSHREGIELFNLTATFSRFSHFPLVLQHLPSLEHLGRAPVPLGEKNRLRGRGLAPVLYLQSHCGVASDRDAYVKELMRFLPVDSYGACLHNKDLPPHLVTTDTHNDERLFSFIAKYKFHLAFENALCEDYITEKLFRALHVGSVPIYRGSPSVRDWAPSNHSVIVADDFASPEELADFVKEVDQSDALYSAYLRFKEDGVSNDLLEKSLSERTWGVDDPSRMDFVRGFECYVCDRIQSPISTSVANRKHMNCHQPHPAYFPEGGDHHQTAFLPKEAPSQESRPQTGKVPPLQKEESCHQMTLLSEDGSSRQTFESPKEESGSCPPPAPPDEWSVEDWEESFFFAYDEARAIDLMVRGGERDSSRFMEYVAKVKQRPFFH